MKLALALFALSACVDAPEDGLDLDLDLDETSQELSLPAFSSFVCTNQWYCNFSVGSPTDVCFLAGVRGPLADAAVYVGPHGGSNTVTIYPGSGSVSITVACVASPAHVTSAVWNTNFGTPNTSISGTTPSSRCFLNRFGADAGGLTNYYDSVKTWRDPNGNWFLGGSRQTGWLTGGAVCFDAINVGEWAWGQGVPGSITGNLAGNSNHDVACGLTELGGVFTTPTGDDGVSIKFASKAQLQWVWTLMNYKHAYANCIK